MLRGQAEKKAISLTYEAPDGLPEYVSTDPVRFRQLLTNLIGQRHQVHRRRRRARRRADVPSTNAHPQLIVDVIDTGIGIPDETLEKIFDPFVQADTSVTRRFGGTGLGLAISRRFAEALGGELTVQSELGKGSIFTFTIDTGPLDGVRTVTVDQLTQSLRKPTAAGTIQRSAAGRPRPGRRRRRLEPQAHQPGVEPRGSGRAVCAPRQGSRRDGRPNVRLTWC